MSCIDFGMLKASKPVPVTRRKRSVSARIAWRNLNTWDWTAVRAVGCLNSLTSSSRWSDSARITPFTQSEARGIQALWIQGALRFELQWFRFPETNVRRDVGATVDPHLYCLTTREHPEEADSQIGQADFQWDIDFL